MVDGTAADEPGSRAVKMDANIRIMPNREKLSDDAVAAFVTANAGWTRAERGSSMLTRTFSFDDYAAGIAFAVRVGFAADARDHHPDMAIGYRRVEVAWSTHDAGGISEIDVEMAKRTDTLART
jgi:4a-hydroxytetrahydrobiopterin dehydratase